MYTADRRRFLERSIALAGALVACNPLEKSPQSVPPSKEKRPLTTAVQKVESIVSLDKTAGAAWEIKQLGTNPLLPEGEVAKDTSRLPVVLYTANKLFLRTRGGHSFIVDAKSGEPIWKSQAQGVVTGADEQTFVFFSEQNFNLQLFDTQTQRPVGRPLAPEPAEIPRNESARHWRFPAHMGKEVIVLPYGRTVLGTQDGFTVLNRNGETLWKGPIDFPYTKFLGFAEGKLVVHTRGENKISIVDGVTGARLETLPAHIDLETGELAFAILNHWAITMSRLESIPREGTRLQIHAYDVRDGKVWKSPIISNGWFDRVVGTNQVVCAYHCNLNFNKIYAVPTDYATGYVGEITIFVEAASGPINKRGPYFYSAAELDVYRTGLQVMSGDLLKFSSRPIIQKKQGVSHTYTDTVYEVYPYLKLPYTEKQGQPNRKEVYLNWYDPKYGSRSVSYYIDGADLVGKVNDEYFVLVNWNDTFGVKPQGNRKLFLAPIDNTPTNTVREVDLQTTNPLKVVVRENRIIVIGESLVEINPETGNPRLLSFMGNGVFPRQISETDSKIIVETSDNRLISFPLSSLG